MVQVIVLLPEHDAKIAQRRMVRPELAGEGGFLRGDREKKKMIDRQHGPYQHRNADQQKLRLSGDLSSRREPHRESRFIMKYTSGSTRGSAITIAPIDRSTMSRRRYRMPSVASTCVRSPGPPPVNR